MLSYMTLKDHVYEYISKRIQDGSLKPDDRLNEQDISDELNISRTPVREALIELAADGLLYSQPRRGFRVKPLTLKEAKELYQLIGNLDAMAAVLAVQYINPEDIQSMKNLISDMERSIKGHLYDIYYKLQVEFHNIYINKCGHDELIRVLNQLKMRFIRQGYSNKEEQQMMEVFTETNEQHKIIVELIEAKDSKKLESYLKEIHWNIQYASLDAL